MQSSGIRRPRLASARPVSSGRSAIPIRHAGAGQEVSRAFATEDVATPGKNRARFNAVFSREKTTCGVEPLSPEEVSAHSATGAVSVHSTGERSRCGVSRVETKEPHPSPPVTVNEKVCFQIAVGFSRGSTLLRSCDDCEESKASEPGIWRCMHLVTELGFVGHGFFLCSQYSATGRF